MNHKFTEREKVLLLILIVLAIVCGYYLLVMKPVSERISNAEVELADAESEMLIEAAKNMQIRKMQEELDKLKSTASEDTGILADYDNIQNVLRELNEILPNVNCNFNPVVFEDKIARRTIDMSFTSNNYSDAKQIVSKLYASKYRCNITSLSIESVTGNQKPDINKDSVLIKLTVTFLEYVNDKTE